MCALPETLFVLVLVAPTHLTAGMGCTRLHLSSSLSRLHGECTDVLPLPAVEVHPAPCNSINCGPDHRCLVGPGRQWTDGAACLLPAGAHVVHRNMHPNAACAAEPGIGVGAATAGTAADGTHQVCAPWLLKDQNCASFAVWNLHRTTWCPGTRCAEHMLLCSLSAAAVLTIACSVRCPAPASSMWTKQPQRAVFTMCGPDIQA